MRSYDFLVNDFHADPLVLTSYPLGEFLHLKDIRGCICILLSCLLLFLCNLLKVSAFIFLQRGQRLVTFLLVVFVFSQLLHMKVLQFVCVEFLYDLADRLPVDQGLDGQGVLLPLLQREEGGLRKR